MPSPAPGLHQSRSPAARSSSNEPQGQWQIALPRGARGRALPPCPQPKSNVSDCGQSMRARPRVNPRSAAIGGGKGRAEADQSIQAMSPRLPVSPWNLPTMVALPVLRSTEKSAPPLASQASFLSSPVETMLNATGPLTVTPSDPMVLSTPSLGGAWVTNAPVVASML